MMRIVPAAPVLALLAGLAAACGSDSTGPKSTPPVLQSSTPAQGGVGTEVRVNGSGFTTSGPMTVYFGTHAAAAADVESGALFATAPTGLVAGQTYDLRVVNPGGASDTLSAAFTAVAPQLTRVNGVSKPTGLRGMTVVIEGSAFGDDLHVNGAAAYFGAPGIAPIRATIADTANDWSDGFIVTTVPQAVPDTSWIWVETPTGVSDSVEFRIIQSGTFSPSLINWTETTPLPQPLQGLGAVFVAVENGPSPGNHVFTIGGADSQAVATRAVYHAGVQQTGALAGAWDVAAGLPEKRAFSATAAATPFTAAVDTLTTAGYLYALGGIDSTGATTTTAYVARIGLDGAVDPWQETTSLPQALDGASAVVFRGFLYLAGGAGADSAAVTSVYRAQVNADGTLGSWESLPDMPIARSYHALVSFGPYLYAVGGETGQVGAELATLSGGETGAVAFARVNLRTGDLTAAGWSAVSGMGKSRSKHSSVFAGGALFVTSGVYAGDPGSSENTYASLNSDGTLASWQGATGSETIDAAIGYSLYDQAMVTFIDQSGQGHVLVLGGADRAQPGHASAVAIYY